MAELKVGETYSDEELYELCKAEVDDRYFVVVGKKATVIVSDAGNGNYIVEHICNYTIEE